jgi:hypothetical protein
VHPLTGCCALNQDKYKLVFKLFLVRILKDTEAFCAAIFCFKSVGPVKAFCFVCTIAKWLFVGFTACAIKVLFVSLKLDVNNFHWLFCTYTSVTHEKLSSLSICNNMISYAYQTTG